MNILKNKAEIKLSDADVAKAVQLFINCDCFDFGCVNVVKVKKTRSEEWFLIAEIVSQNK